MLTKKQNKNVPEMRLETLRVKKEKVAWLLHKHFWIVNNVSDENVASVYFSAQETWTKIGQMFIYLKFRFHKENRVNW